MVSKLMISHTHGNRSRWLKRRREEGGREGGRRDGAIDTIFWLCVHDSIHSCTYMRTSIVIIIVMFHLLLGLKIIIQIVSQSVRYEGWVELPLACSNFHIHSISCKLSCTAHRLPGYIHLQINEYIKLTFCCYYSDIIGVFRHIPYVACTSQCTSKLNYALSGNF